MTPAEAEVSLRRRVFDVIEDVGPRTRLPGLFAGSLIVLILVNVVAAILETCRRSSASIARCSISSRTSR